jgi:hypothetical protein
MRVMRGVLVISVLSALMGTAAFAGDGTNVTTPKFFQWYPDWSAGALLIGGALFGTLFVVFTSIGGTIPGTAGQATLERDRKDYEKYVKRLDGLFNNGKLDPASVTAVHNVVHQTLTDIRSEQWREFGLAAALYVVLGSFIALALAADWLQAIVVSAGWTGYLGSFGLKKAGEAKDDALDKAASAPSIGDDLKRELSVARAL